MGHLLLLMILGASLVSCEKMLPASCLGSLPDQKASAQRLCKDLRQNLLDSSAAREVIISREFNSKDGLNIVDSVRANPSNCLNIVKKQCELIELRNGVGY